MRSNMRRACWASELKIEIAGTFKRFLNGAGGDFVEDDALDFIACFVGKAEGGYKVPGDRFAFAVFIGRQNYL